MDSLDISLQRWIREVVLSAQPVSRLSGQDIANLLWACCKIKLQPPWLDKYTVRATTQIHTDTFLGCQAFPYRRNPCKHCRFRRRRSLAVRYHIFMSLTGKNRRAGAQSGSYASDDHFVGVRRPRSSSGHRAYGGPAVFRRAAHLGHCSPGMSAYPRCLHARNTH